MVPPPEAQKVLGESEDDIDIDSDVLFAVRV